MQQVNTDLVRGLQDLSPVDRAAVLSLVNALIDLAADKWGPGVAVKPAGIKRDVAADIVAKLASSHSRVLTERLEPVQKRGMKDMTYAQAMRQIRAYEVVIATLGVCLSEGPKDAVMQAWKLLWASRAHAGEAAASMMRFGTHAGIDPLPLSRRLRGPIKSADVERLASTLPTFLMRKKSNPVAKPPARTAVKAAR
ncbi:hypothetical protein BSY19_5114 (plasmid) [Bosea sp. RAC05]|nr:hypothetical protein BSY19_5114 [Bosea sp. RAC05]